jgi:D-glycero-D-manno-heptose 1,7-bisphosphate phosphatase
MKLVILDRDGTINVDSPDYIKSPAEWTPIAGSLEAIARLHQADYRVVVATNQSGIGRGLFDTKALFEIHEKLQRALGLVGGRIDAFFFCPHTADSKCACRKPRPGMLLEIGRRFNVPLGEVAMVGDALRDLEAAAAAGVKPVLVLTGKGAKTKAEGGLPPGTRIFPDLAAFAEQLAP